MEFGPSWKIMKEVDDSSCTQGRMLIIRPTNAFITTLPWSNDSFKRVRTQLALSWVYTKAEHVLTLSYTGHI